MRKIIGLWNKVSLVKRIIVGLIIGILLGLFFPQLTFLSTLGDLFVGALKAVAPLLVLFLVMSALSRNKQGKKTNIKRIIFLYILVLNSIQLSIPSLRQSLQDTTKHVGS